MESKYCAYCDEPYQIDRDARKERVVIRDYEGNEIWTFPGYFSNEVISAAMSLADYAYNAGLKEGAENKVNEIKSALLM